MKASASTDTATDEKKPPPKEPSKYSPYYWAAFGIYGGVIISVTIVMIILIAM